MGQVRQCLRRRVFAVGVMAPVTAALGVLLSVGVGGVSRAVAISQLGRFVAVVQGQGVRQSMGLYSASTGARVRSLGAFGMNLTGEGLAVTPGDDAVFYAVNPRDAQARSLNLMRLDVASGRQNRVAEGQQPAVDSAGGRLAFMTGPQNVAVCDLHTGTQRELDLARIVGFQIDPLSSRLGWLGDPHSLVMLPAEPATPVTSNGHTASSRTIGRCRPTKNSWPLVFIHVPRAGRLSARCRSVSATAALPAPIADGATVLAPSPIDPAAVWIASFDGPVNTIQQVRPTGAPELVATLGRDVLPEAIDRTSDHILYISGHPPALWEATISHGRLAHRHKLVGHSRFEAAAW